MKNINRLLWVVAVLLTPITLFLNNVGGMLAYTQATAAVDTTNKGGASLQLLKSVTSLQDYTTPVSAVWVLSLFGLCAIAATKLLIDENEEINNTNNEK